MTPACLLGADCTADCPPDELPRCSWTAEVIQWDCMCGKRICDLLNFDTGLSELCPSSGSEWVGYFLIQIQTVEILAPVPKNFCSSSSVQQCQILFDLSTYVFKCMLCIYIHLLGSTGLVMPASMSSSPARNNLINFNQLRKKYHKLLVMPRPSEACQAFAHTLTNAFFSILPSSFMPAWRFGRKGTHGRLNRHIGSQMYVASIWD